MPKIRDPKKISIGDVFWTSFLDNHGKRIQRHPFIVIQTLEDETLQILDARAILGAAAVTDIHSKKGKELKEALERGIYNNSLISKEDGATKPSIAQMDTYYLFSKDLMPVDVSKMFSEKKTKQIVSQFVELFSEEKIKINKENLLPVSIIDENTDENKIEKTIKNEEEYNDVI